MQTKTPSCAALLFIFVLMLFIGGAHAKEECHAAPIDPSWNRNDNKRGTACYRQMQEVRKLEFDPRFDCSKEIRQRWQREMNIAIKMRCKL
jgi:hypothetical protein